MNTVDTSHLQALAVNKATKYNFDRPDAKILESFASPLRQRELSDARLNAGFTGSVKIVSPEFTSLCPLTGQPDFATIVIEYHPRLLCVESKSLKLYLMSFREHGEFHESCIQRIADDLVALLDPLMLRVEGQFTPRGGIPFWPTVEYCSR